MLTYLFLIVTTLSWSANTVFAILSVGEASPMVIVFCRWFGVSILVLVFAFKYIQRDIEVFKQHKWYFLRLALMGFAIFNSLYYIASYTTTAVNIGILQGAIPMIVLVGSVLFLKTKISSLQVVGVVITMLGVVLVSVKGSVDALIQLAFVKGDVLMLIACVMYASYTIGLKNRPDINPLSFFSYLAFLAAISSVPLLGIEMMLGETQYPTQKGWMIIVLITLLPSFLAQVLYIMSVKNIGPERASVFVNLIPIFSTIMAAFILKESIQWYHLTALAMVIGGIALSERTKLQVKI